MIGKDIIIALPKLPVTLQGIPAVKTLLTEEETVTRFSAQDFAKFNLKSGVEDYFRYVEILYLFGYKIGYSSLSLEWLQITTSVLRNFAIIRVLLAPS